MEEPDRAPEAADEGGVAVEAGVETGVADPRTQEEI